MKIIKREDYLAKLRALRGQNLIKVITGVRRSGKSTLLKMYRDELVAELASEVVQYINFEDPKYSYGMNWNDIYSSIDDALVDGEMNYIFLDEVQYIEGFERLLVGLQTKENVDLYVTGSNARMLSSELATLLSGRAVEIAILPFSFREYLEVFEDDDGVGVKESGIEPKKESEVTISRGDGSLTILGDMSVGARLPVAEYFNNYLSFGGFPQAVSIFRQDKDAVDSYLSGIYETIAGRDILDRGEVTDKIALNAVMRFLLDNVGSFTSVHNVAVGLEMSDRKVGQIVDALGSSFLFYKLGRIDVRGKELLKTQEKYYAVDLGLRWAMLGRDAASDMGHLLENVVFLELKRRDGKVLVGKVGNTEIDFVVREVSGETAYYQVAWSVRSEETLARELAPLRKIPDFNQRYLITMDPEEPVRDGVRQVNAVKWLVGN